MSELNEQQALAACPFCGGKEVMQHLDYSMMCVACGAEGALHETLAEAIAAWNRRSPASPAVQPPADELSKLVLHAIYRACQRGGSAEQLHAAIMPAVRAAVAASTVSAAPAEPVARFEGWEDYGDRTRPVLEVLHPASLRAGTELYAGQPPAQPALQADAGAFPTTYAIWDGAKMEWQFGEPERAVCLYATDQLIKHAVASVQRDRSERVQADAKNADRLNAALMRACQELPIGYNIRVEVERDAGWVEWEDDNGDCRHIDTDEAGLAENVEEALDAAINDNSRGRALTSADEVKPC